MPKKIESKFFFQERRFELVIGSSLILLALIMFFSFISHLFTGKVDQSIAEAFFRDTPLVEPYEVKNWFGIVGAYLSYLLIYRLFGITTWILPFIIVLWGTYFFHKKTTWILYNIRLSLLALFTIVWVSLCLGYVAYIDVGINALNDYCGYMGYLIVSFLMNILGHGTPLLLLLILFSFCVYFFGIEKIKQKLKWLEEKILLLGKFLKIQIANLLVFSKSPIVLKNQSTKEIFFSKKKPTTPRKQRQRRTKNNTQQELSISKENKDKNSLDLAIEDTSQKQITDSEKQIENQTLTTETSDQNDYNPKLDLSNYQYPSLELLNVVKTNRFQVTRKELEENKDNIVETLRDFKITVSSIKATIGPTVTLYEIIPDAGIKISKIKNLEDDIALSLAALGIRIIAPIPGKGTVGIEVPNKNRSMVAICEVLGYSNFYKSSYALPVALGKTISNDTFLIDLAKLPHLLIAGATGQGKSVGINVLLTCLLYKKHPAELKLILVDPKKVELSLFNKIEKHFLATLPFAEESIITDTSQVSKVLKSLCTEMDIRYNLLKEANCRLIKEYNKKFVSRRLSPKAGHKFLPYIVLVIDELADLMMMSGKEVEMPIARLAQLARAVGIHLVVATQRPSVDVITGLIKANFPARLSFKVTSKIDSRTILDTGGADQLIGMGDMLFSNGAELIRLQCAFIETEEVQRICQFIQSQQSYPNAYFLPEVEEDSEKTKAIDLKKRDSLFEDCARLVVTHQQGSASLLQRKLSIGYNRAGRIIDQLEAVGIVGNFDGSKAREVLIRNENSLKDILENLPQSK